MPDRPHDPLAGRTDRPDYVPDADMRPDRKDRRRDGALGTILVVALPILILGAAITMWSLHLGDRGAEGPAIDTPEHMQPTTLLD